MEPAFAVVAAALLLASCATRAGPEAQPTGAAQAGSDRSSSGVGVQIRRATPKPLRKGLHNVLQNADEPVVVINDGLQGRIGDGGRTLVRFVINSTIGLAGIFDVAKRAGLPHHDNGFAMTLGRYGVAPGPELHLPVVGPLTLRQAVGGAVDFVVDPLGLPSYSGSQTVNIARTLLGLVYDPDPRMTQDQRAAAPPDKPPATSAEAPSPPPAPPAPESGANELPPY
jgi:hypothetical protein